jgi:hypothetical protein
VIVQELGRQHANVVASSASVLPKPLPDRSQTDAAGSPSDSVSAPGIELNIATWPVLIPCGREVVTTKGWLLAPNQALHADCCAAVRVPETEAIGTRSIASQSTNVRRVTAGKSA